ncbi:hypothetical protein [Jiella pelagia]|uniref:hypothetical protein n=1 Tax=Jiella pelagia TaxID=2986949 RepID=UPI0022A7234A|nr:hypothetical protein [Jiella pelagia]
MRRQDSFEPRVRAGDPFNGSGKRRLDTEDDGVPVLRRLPDDGSQQSMKGAGVETGGIRDDHDRLRLRSKIERGR